MTDLYGATDPLFGEKHRDWLSLPAYRLVIASRILQPLKDCVFGKQILEFIRTSVSALFCMNHHYSVLTHLRDIFNVRHP